MSSRLFYVIAAVAVAFTVAGVLVLMNRRGGSEPGATSFGGKDDPVLDAKVRRLQFTDWEANVIGPDGRPAPDDPRVTGGTRAGRAGGLTFYDAVVRAARRPAKVDDDNGRTGSLFFAVDRGARRVIGVAEPTRGQALAGAPAGATVAEVKDGTTIVAAKGAADRWYVLDDAVAFSGTEIRDAREGTNQATGKVVTLFAYTDTGLRKFQALTKALAARGAQASLNAGGGGDPALHNQHFAVLYDGQVVTAPAVDFQRSPDGLNAAAGTQLAERLP
jgi:SecD/SecF fusion protein